MAGPLVLDQGAIGPCPGRPSPGVDGSPQPRAIVGEPTNHVVHAQSRQLQLPTTPAATEVSQWPDRMHDCETNIAHRGLTRCPIDRILGGRGSVDADQDYSNNLSERTLHLLTGWATSAAAAMLNRRRSLRTVGASTVILD